MLNRLHLAVFIAAGLLAGGVGLALAQEGDPKRGAELYAANCAVCHGPEGKGRIGANLTRDFGGIDLNAFLQQTIANGVSGTRMPAWSQAQGGPLSEQDIADVAAYVNGLLGGTEPVAPAPTFIPPAITPAAGVTGDPAAGAAVFAANCVVCHGQQGQGRIGATLQKNWPGINPAAYIRATVEKGIDGSLMPPWLDASGGPLTAQDIDDVSAYILSLDQGQPVNVPPTPAVAAGPISFGTGMAILAVAVVLIGVVIVIYYRRA